MSSFPGLVQDVRAGAPPLDPGFLWPLVATRWFLGPLSLVRSRGYFLRYAKTDLGRIFGIKYAKKHFGERRFPNQAHPPKAFPLGGRCPSAHTGADEGAILYPTFPCRKGTLSRLSPQRGFSIAPLGNPVAPSSVTFGDSFPPRGSLWVVQPYTKKRPKSEYVHGHRASPTTVPLRPATPKPASGNERALKKGGRGPSPATLCVRAFSRESLDPRPGPGGNPRGRSGSAMGLPEPPIRGSTVLRTLRVDGSEAPLGRCAPRLRKSPAHPKGTQYRPGAGSSGAAFLTNSDTSYSPSAPSCGSRGSKSASAGGGSWG